MTNSQDQPQADLDSRLRIVIFEPWHAKAFRDLNLDWIEEFFVVEELDRRHLDFPQESFVDTGGAILGNPYGGTGRARRRLLCVTEAQ